MIIGQNIRNLRQRNGWSQDHMAKQLDISIPAFSKIETGVTDINLSRLEQIACVFKIPAVELLMLNDSNINKFATELDTANKKLVSRDAEVIDLQNKIIQLFEELRKAKNSALRQLKTVPI
jgi:transcriptional regulator with XRE-family HTH domain